MVETTNIFDLLGDNDDEVDSEPEAVAPKAPPAKAKEIEKPGRRSSPSANEYECAQCSTVHCLNYLVFAFHACSTGKVRDQALLMI